MVENIEGIEIEIGKKKMKMNKIENRELGKKREKIDKLRVVIEN